MRNKFSMLVALLISVLVGTIYVASTLKSGWLPEDDGCFAQSALRVARGQLPHRDFVENYTGGLSCLNAGAFRLFGVNLFSLRIPLFALCLAWIFAVFYIASRFSGPVTSALVTLLSVAWAIPIYPTPMPSWYNLFFAVFGAATLYRFIESNHRLWVFWAGVFGGLSFDVKVVGLYYVAAVLLFLLFLEQRASRTGEEVHVRPARLYQSVVIVGLLIFLVLLAWLIRSTFTDSGFVHLFLPSLSLVALLIYREATGPTRGSKYRFLTLLRLVVPFLAGFALPVVLLLVPYVASGSVHIFISGVFKQGLQTAQGLATYKQPPIRILVLGLLPLGVLAILRFGTKRLGVVGNIAATSGAAVLLLVCVRRAEVARAVFLSTWMLTSLVVLAGAVLLGYGESRGSDKCGMHHARVMLLLGLAGMCSLVQFPFPAPIYFCYTAPLTILALAALVCGGELMAFNPGIASVAIFYTLFAVLVVAPVRVYDYWMAFRPLPPVERLDLPRSGGVSIPSAPQYKEFIRFLQQKSRNEKLVATPQCPDVYFLSGLENITTSDNGLSDEQILSVMQRDDLDVIVLNIHSVFKEQPVSSTVIERASQVFPYSAQFGKYVVMWR